MSYKLFNLRISSSSPKGVVLICSVIYSSLYVDNYIFPSLQLLRAPPKHLKIETASTFFSSYLLLKILGIQVQYLFKLTSVLFLNAVQRMGLIAWDRYRPTAVRRCANFHIPMSQQSPFLPSISLLFQTLILQTKVCASLCVVTVN